MPTPTSLIVKGPFTEPARHWAENTDRTLRLEGKRRPAGYEIIDTRENTRRLVAIPLVDDIRQRVGLWRTDGWPGVTAVTRELLGHWWDLDRVSGRQYRFYFCQLEAIETMIWYTEAQAEYRQGISVTASDRLAAPATCAPGTPPALPRRHSARRSATS